jgi:hypothetical protein
MRFQKAIAIVTEMFWMNAEFAVEKASPKVTAIATATKLMLLENAAERAIVDADNDGICDDIDTCVGTLDACDVCNGPGDIYECGCADIPEGDCDCNGNELDALGVMWRFLYGRCGRRRSLR